MTMALTASSASACSIAATRPARTAWPSALTGGLLEVTTSTSPCLWVEIGLVVGLSRTVMASSGRVSLGGAVACFKSATAAAPVRMAPVTLRPGIFPTFFLSGFECSTFDWGDKGRRDLNEELQHYAHADEDYAVLGPLGIAVAREGIPWPLVDKGDGEYDFRCIDDFLDAQRRHNILP